MFIWKLKKLKAKKSSKKRIKFFKQNFIRRLLKIIIQLGRMNGFNSFKILKDRLNNHRYLKNLTLSMEFLTFLLKILH